MKIIAFDLDNTFLSYDKSITDENIAAIKYAVQLGVVPVVSTGRLYPGIPEPVREICRFFITINGAKVYDKISDSTIYESLISSDQAMNLYAYADKYDCIYDAYINDGGYMNRDMYDVLEDYVADKNYAKMMKAQRTPIPDIKEFITSNNCSVQKIQYHFRDIETRNHHLKILPEIMPEFKFSCSLGSNLEVNSYGADKGIALEKICSYLNIPIEESVAFGDGLNDMPMIKSAGIGYSMLNGDSSLKAAADRITQYDCDNSGVGREILNLLK